MSDRLGSTYLHFDGMAWPNPADPAGVQWALSYGTLTREQCLIAASMIGAYKQLVADAKHRRDKKITALRVAMALDSDPEVAR